MKSKFDIYNFFEKYWLFLPALSVLLLVLSFYPFDFWFLSLVALVPLFYFVTFSKETPSYKIFLAGAFFGAAFSSVLSFFTLVQFHWLPETYLFVWGVRFSFLPIAIVSGFLAGLAVILYRKLRLGSLVDIFTGAAVWVLIEWLVDSIFRGFHLGLLGYTLRHTPLLNLASLGGVFLVSYLVILVNAFIVSILLWNRYRILYPELYQKGYLKHPSENPFAIFFYSTRRIIFIFLITFSVIGAIYGLNNIYLNSGGKNPESKSFALIQLQERKAGAFGEFQNKEFSFEKLEKLIQSANKFNPDFIIYPFTPFIGLLSETSETTFNKDVIVGDFEHFGRWTEKNIFPKSVLVTWNNALRNDNPYNEFDFWQNNKQIAYYQKRVLFPFLDYTPTFSQKMGFFTTPYDASAGPGEQKIVLDNLKISNLVCSELNDKFLTREDSKWANIFMALGSEAIFEGDIPGNFNIVVSQFRAAENNLPLIRGTRFGPSAIIDNQGKILAKLDFGEEGILFKKIEYQLNPKRTLYSYLGDWGLISAILIFLIIVLFLNWKSKKFREKQAA